MPNQLPCLPSLRRSMRLLALLLTTIAAGSGSTLGQCPGEGSCIEIHGTPGCSDQTCCLTVCDFAPQCCQVAWDVDCVLLADELCKGMCGATSSGSCFLPNGSPGCDDIACCEMVCAQDPFCCEEDWDSTCVFVASLICEPSKVLECGDPGTGSCFVPHLGSACNDKSCCNAVCQLDPTCCSGNWDTICAAIAMQTCVDSCELTCPPGAQAELETCTGTTNSVCLAGVPDAAPEPFTCPGIVCGQIRDAGVSTPDVDVYEVTLVDGDGDGEVRVKLTFAAEFVGYAAMFPAGCDGLATAPLVVSSLKCVPYTTIECLPAGTWWILVASGTFPNTGGQFLDCPSQNHYRVELTCDEQCGPVCGGGGDCFMSHTAPGCDDEPCCDAVCDQDPFCCQETWDLSCVLAAFALCDGPTPSNDECSDCITVGTGATSFSTLGATTSDAPLLNSCSNGSPELFQYDIWYCFTATCDGFAIVSTCGMADFDTWLAAYTGSCGNLTQVACNDDGAGCNPPSTSRMNIATDCGVTYYIRLGGFSGAAGTGTMTITCIGSACPQLCPADLDGNGTVDGADLGILLGAWGNGGPADLDHSGAVDGADLGILLGAWGPC